MQEVQLTTAMQQLHVKKTIPHALATCQHKNAWLPNRSLLCTNHAYLRYSSDIASASYSKDGSSLSTEMNVWNVPGFSSNRHSIAERNFIVLLYADGPMMFTSFRNSSLTLSCAQSSFASLSGCTMAAANLLKQRLNTLSSGLLLSVSSAVKDPGERNAFNCSDLGYTRCKTTWQLGGTLLIRLTEMDD